MARAQVSAATVVAIVALVGVKVYLAADHDSSSSSYDSSYDPTFTPNFPTTDPTDPNDKMYEVSDVKPMFGGFDSDATTAGLQGVWIAGAEIVEISGSSMSRHGDVNYSNAPITVHAPCSFSVEHDGKGYEASFGLVPEGPRFDEYDGAIVGSMKVVCNGPDIYIINPTCQHWGTLQGDEWTQEGVTCTAETEADGTVKVTPSEGDPMFLRPVGNTLVPVDSDDDPPVKYASVADAQKVVDGRKAIEKQMIVAAATPSAVDEAVAIAEFDPTGMDVKLKGVVQSVDPDALTATLADTKDADADAETVVCTFAKLPKLKPRQSIKVKGTISDLGDGNITLSPCAVSK